MASINCHAGSHPQPLSPFLLLPLFPSPVALACSQEARDLMYASYQSSAPSHLIMVLPMHQLSHLMII